MLTAILDRGGTGTQPSGGSSVPKISAVPVTRRTRRGALGSTSTRSSLCGASLYCRGGCGVAAPAPAVVAAAMVRGFWRRRDGEGLGVAGAGGLRDLGVSRLEAGHDLGGWFGYLWPAGQLEKAVKWLWLAVAACNISMKDVMASQG